MLQRKGLTSIRQPAGSKRVVATPAAFTAARPRALHVVRASETESKPLATTSSRDGSEIIVVDTEFSITKISYGSILVPVGCGLLSYGFGAFFQFLPGGDLSALMLIYGFPISVLGFALAYAQLEPVACKTTKAGYALRDSQMTDIQKQIRSDTTRFRYGDQEHLEEALGKIFRVGKTQGVNRRVTPRLTGLREEASESGAYTLVLEFENKLSMEEWETRQPKFQSFFGPGIVANIKEVGTGVVEVALVCDGSGQGRGGEEQKDLLMPLMPGMPGRKQQ